MALVRMGVLGTAISGTVGDTVFVQTAQGTVARSRPTVNNPNTDAQAQQRYAFTRAQTEYRLLTRAENAAWKQYSLSPASDDPDTGAPGGRTAYAAFLSLSVRFVTLNPHAAPPRLPPKFPYSGDPVTLAISTLPGQIVLAASAANSSNNRTVIALLALKFASQSYRLRDLKTVEAVQFTPDELSLVIAVEPGWYALATHFISVQTGQWTAHTEYEPFEAI